MDRTNTWGEPLESPLDDDDEHGSDEGHHFDRSKTAPMGFAWTGGTATLKGTVFNLINTVIGAGLLALPQAVQMNGIVLGCGMVILVAVLADITCNMLLYATDTVHETNFGKISLLLAGKVVKFFVDLIIFLLNFGLCTSYCIICLLYTSPSPRDRG